MSSSETTKNPFHRRNCSDELDVFEAAGYFSGTGNQNSYRLDQRQKQRQIQKPAGRISLDNHHRPIPAVCHVANHKKHEQQKQQQPRSPGSRLASFLNSLFHQTKKKPKPRRPGAAAAAAAEGEEERRKRQSSINQFRMIATNTDSKSPTGPVVCAADDTPTKSYKDSRHLSDRRQAVDIILTNDSKETLENALRAERKTGQYWSSMEGLNRGLTGGDSWPSDERELRKFSEDDSSESSSDLFDLPNHELDFYPCGLPVYETTRVDDIKIGGPAT